MKTTPVLQTTVFLVVVLALSLAVCAQTSTPVQQAMSNFGLVGNWAVDCNSGHRDAFTYTNDVVYDTLDFGQNRVRSYIHTEAHLLDSAHLSVTVTVTDNFNSAVNGQVQTLIYFKRPDGRMRVVSNIRDDGTVIVKDGVVVASGFVLPSWGPCR